jgi:hypothetical protein
LPDSVSGVIYPSSADKKTFAYEILCSFFARHIFTFISFAPPKEMNQRKGGPKCQPQPFWALATQSLNGATKKAAVRTISGFAPAPSFKSSVNDNNYQYFLRILDKIFLTKHRSKQYRRKACGATPHLK